MKRFALLLLVLAATVAMNCETSRAQGAPPPPAEQQQAAAPAEGQPEQPAPPPPPEKSAFEKAVEGFKPVEGLFTFYVKEDELRALLAIKPEQLNKVFLCNVTLEAGDGHFMDSGAMLSNFPFELRKVGKKIQVVLINLAYRAEPGSPLARAIARGVSESVIASSPLVCDPDPKTGAMLIDPSPIFLQDLLGIGVALNQIGAGYYFDMQESRLGELKSFPKNSEIEVIAHYRSGGPPPTTSPAIPDPRSFFHRYRYSLCDRPMEGYRPRYADDRIGLFTTLYMSYDNLTADTPYVRLVNRWRLEKKHPGREVSPPKEPIVFWLENTIPHEYRPAVRDGVLEWNKAFEKAGIKDAIVVRQQPDDADWDGADIRYNCIRWIVMPEAGYAVGPSLADPYTGEIYAADVRICADFIRYYAMNREMTLLPEAPAEYAPIKLPGMSYPLFKDTFAQGMSQRVAYGLDLLEARWDFNSDSPEAKQFLYEATSALVTHEVGHALGLRHNFRASSIRSLYDLQDREFAEREGLTGSVMDYNDANFAGPGMKQGAYWQTTLGPWDYWTIEYGYKDLGKPTPNSELPLLKKIASRASEPGLTYGTDEDAMGNSPLGIDPLTTMWDLGDDPILTYENRIALAKEIISSFERKLEKPGTRYQRLSMVYSNSIYIYSSAGLAAARFIGGIYQNRDHIGDPGGRVPFTPVPAKQQRRALDFLKKHVFGDDSFYISPELLNKLAPERYDDFAGSNRRRQNAGYPVHDRALSIQFGPLNYLYDAATLRRLQDLPLRYAEGEEKFTMGDLFTELRECIWKEVYAKADISSIRRNLQRAHLSILTQLVLGRTGAPADASSLARADLVGIRSAIIDAMHAGGQDTETRAHLDDVRSRITATLEAEVIR